MNLLLKTSACKMAKVLPLCLAVIFCYPVFSQNAESMCVKAKELMVNEPENALIEARKALDVFRKTHAADETRALFLIAQAHKNLGNYDSSLFYYKGCGEKRTKLGSAPLKMAEVFNGTGVVYSMQGRFDAALDFFMKAQKLYEESGDSVFIARGYNNIANVYYGTMNNQKAAVYYERSLGIKQRHHYAEGINSTLINLANIYTEAGTFAKARTCLDTALKYATAKNDMQDLGLIYSKYGTLYQKKKELHAAVKYTEKALEIRKQMQDEYGITECYIDLGNEYSYMSDSKNAISTFKLGLVHAERTGALGHLSELNDRLSAEYMVNDDYRNAYKYLFDHIHFQDSLNNQETAARIAELREKYEVKEKEKNIEKLTAERARQEMELYRKRTLINYIVAASVLIILLITAVYFRRSLKQKNLVLQREVELNREKLAAMEENRQLKERQQKEILNVMIMAQEEERKKIALDLHDGLGQLLSGMKLKLELGLQGRSNDGETDKLLRELKDLNGELISESKSMASSLLPYNIQDYGLVTAIKNLCYSNNQLKVSDVNFYSKDVPRKLPDDLEIAVYRIVQELLNNALRHAGATEIFVQLFYREEKLILQVEDNGKGFDHASAKNNPGSMGLKNIAVRVQLLDGRMEIDSAIGHGTTTLIEFPLSHERLKTFENDKDYHSG